MQIGKLATLTGISIRMLRYYEQQGLLRPERTPAGYRRYSFADVNTVKQIDLLNRAGLTLNTISHLTDCLGSTPVPVQLCSALTDKIRQQLMLVVQERDGKYLTLAPGKLCPEKRSRCVRGFKNGARWIAVINRQYRLGEDLSIRCHDIVTLRIAHV